MTFRFTCYAKLMQILCKQRELGHVLTLRNESLYENWVDRRSWKTESLERLKTKLAPIKKSDSALIEAHHERTYFELFRLSVTRSDTNQSSHTITTDG